MPRYIVRRNLGPVTLSEVEAAGRRAKEVRERDFPEISWEHSHVVRTPEGLTAYCIYAGPTVDVVRAHAAAAGLPAHEVLELVADVDPAAL
jgi:uncharacterized protein DUF4242